MNFNFCPKCGREHSVVQRGTTTYACSSCDWQFWNNPKASVTVLLVKQDQLLIATRMSQDSRQDLNGRPELIGGFVDYGESAYDAARREAKEELGVTIKDCELLDVWHRAYDPEAMPAISVVDCTFVVTEWEGTPAPSDDISALEWRPFEAAEDPNLSFPYPGLAEKLKSFIAHEE